MSENRLHGRIVNKHDIEAHWLLAQNFVPMLGEIIIYDADDTHTVPRMKIGDGETLVSLLPFNDDLVMDALSLISAQLEIDYNTHLAFDTAEIVFGVSTSPILGQAILGQLVLA